MFGQTAKVIQYLALTPAVIQLVIVLVQVFETEGNGDAKKKAVLDSVEMVYNQLTGVLNIAIPFDFIKRVAENTIEIAVRFFNLVGLFKKPADVPAAPQQPVA